MRKENLQALVRANIELSVFRHIRKKVAYHLPERGYHLKKDDAWSMAGALIESYVSGRFIRMSDVYNYIAKTKDKLAMDVLESLPDKN